LDSVSINESPYSLHVRALEEVAGSSVSSLLAKLIDQPFWAAAALELIVHLAETSGELNVVFGENVDPLLPFAALRAPALSALNKLRMQKQLVRVFDAVLSEDANKVRLIRHHALPLCGALLSSGVAVLSRSLHMFVCRFGAFSGVPLASVISGDDLCRIPVGMKKDDLAWRRVFGQLIAAAAPVEMIQALHTLLSLGPGTERSALELMERMGREGRWEAVLGVLPATQLLSVIETFC
jgi:hypothetical protein